MSFLDILILALVQGLAELLPVSSSAHVILAEKLLGLDPTTPATTLLLVMLHTGTMFAVIVYFWRDWRRTYFGSRAALIANGKSVALATVVTGVVGLVLLKLIEHVFAKGSSTFEVEQLFGNTKLIGSGLTAAGVLIIVSSRRASSAGGQMSTVSAFWIGAVQGLCLPFRGFSRSGATISTALLAGVERRRAEEFSFALAVVLTPAVVAREAMRFHKALSAELHPDGFWTLLGPSALGMALSFLAGLLALRWLSGWLEAGRWGYFGFYCLVLAACVFAFA
jgi:undecaprenyl-diphosphatase